MLCLPGFTPVAKDAHAVGDSGEWVVASGIHAALFGEPLHVRQLAFLHPFAVERRVEAVEPENHHPLGVGAGAPPAAACGCLRQHRGQGNDQDNGKRRGQAGGFRASMRRL